MQDFPVLQSKSNRELVFRIKRMFLPLSIQRQTIVGLIRRKKIKEAQCFLQEVYEDNVSYEKKFAEAHFLVFGFTSSDVDASNKIKEMLAERSCLSGGKKLLNNTADLDSVIVVFGEKARNFFKKLDDKKNLAELGGYKWEKGINSFADWYNRLLKILDNIIS